MKDRFLILAPNAFSLINFRAELINLLFEYDYEIHLVAPNLLPGSSDYFDIKKEFPFAYTHNSFLSRGSTGAFNNLRTFLSLLKIISDISPKKILSYTIKPVIFGNIAAKFLLKKHRFVLVTGLGSSFKLLSGRSIKGFVFRLLYRLSLSGTAKIIFQNPSDREDLKKLKIITKLDSTEIILGSGIDTQKFSFHEDLSFNRIRFLFMSRFLTSKGILEFVEASLLIKAEFPEVQIDIAGWVDQENPDTITDDFMQLIMDRSEINFLGRVNPLDVIPSCSVFVLPSYREGLPRSVLEAMSIGRAIITCNVPGCKETVITGKNGFLVDEKSVSGLYEAMKFFALNPEKAREMGVVSRKIVEEKFSLDLINKQMINVLNA